MSSIPQIRVCATSIPQKALILPLGPWAGGDRGVGSAGCRMNVLIVIVLLLACVARAAEPAGLGDAINGIIEKNYASLDELYRTIHSHPELSMQEEQTSKRLATELRSLGYE